MRQSDGGVPMKFFVKNTAATFAAIVLPTLICATVAIGVGIFTSASAAENPDGSTPLHWAVHHDDVAKVKALLASGADAKATNRYGVPPLHLACVNGNEAVVRALLDAGADANSAVRGGETVLMTAARTGRVGPVKGLLERGAKVNATNRDQQTALMWAAADGHAAVVQTLLDAGADRYGRLESGFTAFLFAARNGRSEVVRTLLKAGADANEVIQVSKGTGRGPSSGTSALLLAVENGHFEMAIELVKAGADPNDERTGFTPLHAVTWVRRPKRGDGLDGQPPPDGSGRLSSTQFVRQLVALGANINGRLQRGGAPKGGLALAGATPFLMAARTADLELMKLLVELGADPAIPNKDGATPLMAAAGLGCFQPDEEPGTEPECIAAVEYLLSFGGDVNTVDKNSETAMHGAAYKSLPMMVRLLTSKGAKIPVWNRKNKSGWTPLMIAEGFRPGNFKPSVETLTALHSVMHEAGVPVPPPTPRVDPAQDKKGYEDPSAKQ